MIVEITRLMDRWLQHPEYGFAAQLLLIPRLTPEGTEDPMPVIPLVYNDTEDESVAMDIDPATSPALVLFADEAAEVDATKLHRQLVERVDVTVAYVTREMPPLSAVRDGGYVLKAVKKSLSAYNDQRKSYDFRELNGVKIAAVRTLTHQRIAGAVGQSQLWGFVVAAIEVIDSNP